MDSESCVLTLEVAQKALKRLGRHPITLQHALLELAIPEKNLCNIDEIAKFPNIMHLNVSKNKLSSLTVLSKLPTLVELNASSNILSECLNFCAPHCTSNHAWEEGHNSAGSLLTLADLSQNCIEELRDLSEHRFLERLILHNNKISSINGLHGLKYLKVLDLSYNNLTAIEGLDDLPIQTLKLCGNKITKLTGLDQLPHLSELDVSENLIISLYPLEKCNNLTYLNISSNNIEYIRQCEFLQNIPWLHVLIISNNPCEKKEFYRLRVLYRLPKLKVLDNVEVCLENKIRAFNLYHSTDGDLVQREEVLRKYLAHVPFVDYSPDQLLHDEEMDVPINELQDIKNVEEMPINNENNKEIMNASVVVATVKDEIENIVKNVLNNALEHVLVDV